MHLRKTLLAAASLLIATVALAQPGTEYLVHIPGATSGSTDFRIYLPNSNNNLNPVISTTGGPLNAREVYARPDGQGMYLLSDGPLQYLHPDLQTFEALNALQGPYERAKFTPDGRYLWIFGTQILTFDTLTNQVVRTNLGVTGSAVPKDIVFSHDSKKAWLLQKTDNAGFITPIDLTTLTAGQLSPIVLAAEFISLSPQGHLYVSSTNRIDEFTSDTLVFVATISLVARPGPLHFTPDGSRAYFVNQTPETAGYYVLYFRTKERDWNGWRQLNSPPRFDDIVIADGSRIYGYEKAAHTLWLMDIASVQGAPVNLPTVFNSTKVLAMAISNEVPQARHLYVLEETLLEPLLKRINLATNVVEVTSFAQTTQGEFRYVPFPPRTGAAAFIKVNATQEIPGGGIGSALGATVVDSQGRPVFNIPVTFTTSDPDVTIETPTSITNTSGYVQTKVAAPIVPGVYPVTLTAGSLNTVFDLIVPGAGGGGGGGGGGAETGLVHIVRGDGQTLRENTSTALLRPWAPLTVRVVDEHGNPRPEVPVTFSVVSGNGNVAPLDAPTDVKGEAFTHYTAGNVPINEAYRVIVIRAQTEYGSVDFHQIVYQTADQLTYRNLNDPIGTFPVFVNVGRGELIPNFARVLTKTGNDPLPHVKLRLGDRVDGRTDGPGTCVNDTASGVDGVSRCDLKLSCDTTGEVAARMVIGESRTVPMILVIGPGTSQNLNHVSGSGQSGVAGTEILLTARIEGYCGETYGGRNVVWSIIQGQQSVSLSQIISVSNSAGVVSARATLSATAGPIRIQVAMGNAPPVVFDLTNKVVLSGMSLVSGGGQTVFPSAAFPNPLVFEIRDGQQNPVGAGFSVSFAFTGSAILSTFQEQTNAQGRVLLNVTAGPIPGPITVTATHEAYTSTAQLSVILPPLPLAPISFYNAGSRAEGLVPCGLASLKGSGLAPGITGVVLGAPSAFGTLPYLLQGVKIDINGFPAPIQAVANVDGVQTVNFQAPCQLTAGTATAVVTVNTRVTTVTGVKVSVASPGVFTAVAQSNGKEYGYVIGADGLIVTPENLLQTGKTYYLVLTGLGQTNPPASTNTIGFGQRVALETIVGVADVGVPSQRGIYLGGIPGVYYIEFFVPKTGQPPGTVLKRDVPLAGAIVVDNQVVFGQPTNLPGVVEGP